MKKFTAAAMTAAIALTLGAQAMAAPSVSGGNNSFQATLSPENTSASAAEDTSAYETEDTAADTAYVSWEHEITEENYTQEMLDFVDHLNNLEAGVSVLDAFEGYEGFEEAIDLSNIHLYDVESDFVQEGFDWLHEMYLLSPVKELQYYNVEPTKEKPVKIDFTANDMTEDMEVFILTLCPEHDWELLETVRKSENQVTASFHAKNTLAMMVYIDKSVLEEAEGTSPRT